MSFASSAEPLSDRSGQLTFTLENRHLEDESSSCQSLSPVPVTEDTE